MGREFFSVQNSTSLSQIKVGAKIHVIGVCGVAMAQLAMILSDRGYIVTGSDKEFYEPMGGKLRGSSVKLFYGYDAQNLNKDLDLVVIGNAVAYENPEVQAVEALKLHYSLFPKLLFDLCISGKTSIVVAGTHGKSTTSSMISVMLRDLAENPSYFIGAAVPALPVSLNVDPLSKLCVVEGDEYDSAFFAKVPKFSFYAPNILVVTSIEFDHADIYRDLDHVRSVFTDRVNSLSAADTVICCLDDDNIRDLLPGWRESSICRFISYGTTSDCDYVVSSEYQDGRMALTIKHSGQIFKGSVSLSGKHNGLNICSAFIVADLLSLDNSAALRSLGEFSGARRRQEIRYDHGGITVIDDFAHHPTAVRETLAGLRHAYPQKRIIAVFEPRSNTSRRKVFEAAYAEAFNGCHLAILAKVKARSIDSNLDLIEVSQLAQEITKRGVVATAIDGADAIVDELLKIVTPGDLVVVMSNGSFDQLIDKLISKLP